MTHLNRTAKQLAVAEDADKVCLWEDPKCHAEDLVRVVLGWNLVDAFKSECV